MSDEHDSWLSGIGVNVDNVLDSVQDTASSFADSVQNTVSSAADASIGEAVEGMASAVGQVVSSTADNIRQGVSNVVNVVNQARDVANDVVDSIVETASGAVNSAGEAIESAEEFVEEAIDSADEVSGEDITNLLADLSAADDAHVDGGGGEDGGGGSRADRDRGVIDSLSTQRSDPGKGSDDAVTKGLGKVAEAMLKNFRASPDGKKLEEFARKELDKIPASATIGVPLVLMTGIMAGVVARHEELPITESPDIPLPGIGPVQVSAKITWKGPVDKPKEAVITFNFEISLDGETPQTRVLEQRERRGGASGGFGPRNFRPPAREGVTVLIANFNFGKFNLERIPREIARRPDGQRGRVHVVVFFASPPDSDDEETQRQKNADFQDLARERADTLKRALEQLMPRIRITTDIQPIQRAFDAGVNGNVSVFFTPELS